MIISHTHKYVYLQPLGADAHVGDIVLRGTGLVDKQDVCSAVYLGDKKLYSSQNFKELTLDQYMDKFPESDFHGFIRKPVEQVMTIVNASLTIDELVALDYLTPAQVKEYSIFSFIRKPIDRFLSIFTESQIRRPIAQSELERMFNDSVAKKFTHLLWQDQYPYHMFGGEIISYPLIYDKFYYSIEKMVNTIGSSFKNSAKLQYAYSLNYHTDPTVIGLAEKYKDKLNKIYKKDIELWEKLSDNI
jgi:hypothetical protein